MDLVDNIGIFLHVAIRSKKSAKKEKKNTKKPHTHTQKQTNKQTTSGRNSTYEINILSFRQSICSG